MAEEIAITPGIVKIGRLAKEIYSVDLAIIYIVSFMV